MAQRMGLDNESSNDKCGPLEGEMRRRIWWALLLFDNRVCEMGDYRAVTLSPSCQPQRLRPPTRNEKTTPKPR
jgi:hypothetical protein